MAIHTTCYNELMSGKVVLLIDEKRAKSNLSKIKKRFTTREKIERIEPYKWTSTLISETTNLKINRTGNYLQLELIRAGEEKDTFSAMEYGLHYIVAQEKEHFSRMSKKKSKFSSYLMS